MHQLVQPWYSGPIGVHLGVGLTVTENFMPPYGDKITWPKLIAMIGMGALFYAVFLTGWFPNFALYFFMAFGVLLVAVSVLVSIQNIRSGELRDLIHDLTKRKHD